MVKIIGKIPNNTDWHVHTNYTDGQNTVFEMCEQAVKNNIESIAFTEHVRRSLNYDYEEFKRDIKSAKKVFKNIEILIGCEAKVLNENGKLDIPKSIIRNVDIIIGVFHSFSGDYFTALKNMLENPIVTIWGHPFRFLLKNNEVKFSKTEITESLEICNKNNVLFEFLKNVHFDNSVIDTVKNIGLKTVKSSDAHSITDLMKYEF